MIQFLNERLKKYIPMFVLLTLFLRLDRAIFKQQKHIYEKTVQLTIVSPLMT